MRRSESQKLSLKNSVSKYHASLNGSPAAEYMESRGIPLHLAEKFRLGYVGEPDTGHEPYRGRLAIPYLRRALDDQWSVIGIKFRALDDETSPKYLGLPGDQPRLYNTLDAILNEDEIAVCEGELDALSASCWGIPAVGAPGSTTWQPHWTEIFYGYETVFILTDGDKPGLKFGTDLAKQLGNARIIPMDDGEDVNSMIARYGVDKIKERMGR